METRAGYGKDDGAGKIGSVDDYREAIKKLIDTEVKNALDEELRKAAQELVEEQRKAIQQLVEEHKMAIREVVAEEKKAIWARADELKKSILKMGLW